MSRTHLLLAAVLLAGFTSPVVAWDGNGLFPRKRPDQSRVRYLVELLRSDTDTQKQRAAVTELGDADPRVHPEVMPSLIAALKKDAAAVRAAAAEVIGKFKTTFPLAGAALESTADSDPDATVRAAAKQALWDYHLNGYRSAKSVGGSVQTVEPPFAKVVAKRPPLALAPMPTAVVVAGGAKLPSPKLPEVTSIPSVPETNMKAGPRVSLVAEWNLPRKMLSQPTAPNFKNEPPLARRPVKPTPLPVPPAIPRPPLPHATATLAPTEPPIFIHRPSTGTFGPAPKVIFELPPIVSNPDAQPAPTDEPPVRRVSQK